MKHRTILSFLCLASCLGAAAMHKITFLVTDSTATPESFATVRIYSLPDTTKVLKASTTDLDGKFAEQLPDSVVNCRFIISSLGKAPAIVDKKITGNTDLGTIVLHDASTMLAEVNVVAQRPLVTTEIDRYVYDIKEDAESKTNSIFDMLKKVPMVTVDSEDNIKVKGESNFRIFKNGRPNGAWEKNPKEVLKSIPASMIKRVEVITEPGAKYDAEGVGGILNIVTDEEVVAKGAVGSVGLNASERGSTSAYGYATVQYDKLVLSANYNASFAPGGEYKSRQYGEYIYTATGNRYLVDKNNDSNKTLMQNASLEASYEIDSLNLITAEFMGYFPNTKPKSSDLNTMLAADNSVIYRMSSLTTSPKQNYHYYTGKLDYQRLTRCKDESIIFSYMVNSYGSDTDSRTDYTLLEGVPNFDYDLQLQNNYQNSLENTFQLDWSRPFAKYHRIEAGLKYILRLNHSDTDNKYENTGDPLWKSPLDQNERFRHNAHVMSAYAEYAYNHAKWGARAGLRYEYAYNLVKYLDESSKNFNTHLGDVVPTLGASWKINMANTLKLNFATRINRPSIWFLNPAVTITPVSASTGNPDLVSARHNSLSLGYSLMKPKIMMTLNMRYAFANNTIMEIRTLEDGLMWSRYGNIGRTRNVSLDGYVQYRPTSKTTLMLNGSVNYGTVSRPDTDEKNSGWGMNVYVNVSQDIMWKLKLNAFGMVYRSGVYSLYQTKPFVMYNYGLSLQRSWLKDNRLTTRICANTPFPKWKKNSNAVVTSDYEGRYDYLANRSKLNFSISYRFGSLNSYVKKARKSITNDDVQGGGASGGAQQR